MNNNEGSTNRKISAYLQTVTEQIGFAEARQGVACELQSHIYDRTEMAMQFGVAKDVAVSEALQKMGDPHALGQQFDKIHQPRLDLRLVSLVAALFLTGAFALRSSGWLGLQTVWFTLGVGGAAILYLVSARRLFQIMMAFYPAAIAGLVAAQFSTISYEGQVYLSLFGLKVNMVEIASLMMAVSLPAFGERWQKKAWLDPVLVSLTLGPVLFFSMSGSVGAAAIVLLSGVVCLGQNLKTKKWVYGTASLGFFILLFEKSKPWVEAAGSESLKLFGHTDLILAKLGQDSQWFATMAATLLAALVVYLLVTAHEIKRRWLRTSVLICALIVGFEALVGILINFAGVPIPRTGVNLPFLSYGGSLLVGHLMLIGIALGCLKRRSLSASSFGQVAPLS